MKSDGPAALTQEEILRYSRHLIMPEVGMEGQRRLKEGKILVVGAGGLACPAALYLAAAGVGRIGLVDFDAVDETNLHRQILHDSDKVGVPKVLSARDRLSKINPHVQLDTHQVRLSRENAMDILRNYDIVVDGTDNFPTRYLVNDACVFLRKPLVYASIFRFDGQVSVFWAEKGPCYRCLFPEPPPPGEVPSCAEGGVLGILPGVMGTLQATEAIKLLLGRGDPLVGRLLFFNALEMKFREVKIRKAPDCPVCGPNPTVKELIDYDQFCGVGRGAEEAADSSRWDMDPKEAARLIREGKLFVLDVRQPEEYEISRIEGSRLIPLGELPERVHELDSSRETLVHCHRGSRSLKAIEFLSRIGFKKLHNLRGGIDAWSTEVDPSVPRY